jgi:hypothetical protein
MTQLDSNNNFKSEASLAWWHTPGIPAFWRCRQEALKLEASLSYIQDPVSKKQGLELVVWLKQ